MASAGVRTAELSKHSRMRPNATTTKIASQPQQLPRTPARIVSSISLDTLDCLEPTSNCPGRRHRSHAGIRLLCPSRATTSFAFHRPLLEREAIPTRETLRRNWPPLTQGHAKLEPRAPVAMALPRAGGGDVTSTTRNVFGRLSPSTATLLMAVAFAPMAVGHEHEEGNIPEGSTVSAEPLVRLLDLERGEGELTGWVGHDAMDSHLHPDAGLWDTVPRGHGVGCKSLALESRSRYGWLTRRRR